MKRTINCITAAIASFVIACTALTGSASAISCSGTYDPATSSQILFDTGTSSCSIVDGSSVPGVGNVFAMVLRPDTSPDRLLGIQYTPATFYQPVASLMASDGITTLVGTDGATSTAIFFDFPGSFVAKILSVVAGMPYQMIANLRTGDDNRKIFIDSANVEPVPIPAALPLLATALGGLGLAGWRRHRKFAAARA